MAALIKLFSKSASMDLCLVKILDFDQDGFQFNTISNYVSKYKSGYMTPSDVAEKAIRAFQEIKPLNAIVKYNVKSIRQVDFCFNILVLYIFW